MAKQSGLHQIRGKVGEHSYYKQSGVASGLIRSINQGMSARVKTSEEYANTRLNNQEFAAAANTAGLLGKMVMPKFRPMILPFSQSKMAKEILRLAKQNTGSWGQRTVSSSQTSQLCAVLAAQSKRDFSEFVSLEITRDSAAAANVSLEFSAEQASLMASLGITNIVFRVTQFDLATGNWNAAGGEMATGYIETKDNESFDTDVVAGQAYSADNDFHVATFVPAPNHSGHQLFVVVVMPIRTINNVTHILQEYCSFTAVELPAYNG